MTVMTSRRKPRPTTPAIVPVSTEAMHETLERATFWAEHGYTDRSKAYWSGIRDTLQVMLGITTERPGATGPDCDVAAEELLSAEFRLTHQW